MHEEWDHDFSSKSPQAATRELFPSRLALAAGSRPRPGGCLTRNCPPEPQRCLVWARLVRTRRDDWLPLLVYFIFVFLCGFIYILLLFLTPTLLFCCALAAWVVCVSGLKGGTEEGRGDITAPRLRPAVVAQSVSRLDQPEKKGNTVEIPRYESTKYQRAQLSSPLPSGGTICRRPSPASRYRCGR